MNFNNVLDEYASIPKHNTQQKLKEYKQLPLPRTPASYIPFPKHFKSTRTFTNPIHPMLLRSRFNNKHSFRHRAAQHLLAQNLTSKLLHVFDSTGRKQSIDTLLRQNPKIWNTALSNEIGRFAQGVRDIKGNDALDFVHLSTIPKNKKVAYANMVCNHIPLKTEKHQVRLTLGGDVLEYLGESSSPVASLIESKLIFNSVVSDSHRGA
jgi:hypothetical protein